MNKAAELEFVKLRFRVEEINKFECATAEEKYGYSCLSKFVMRCVALPMTYIIADNTDDPNSSKWGIYLFPAGWLVDVLGPELSGFFLTLHLFTIDTYTYKGALDRIYMFEKGFRSIKDMPVYVVANEFDGNRTCGKTPRWITLQEWEELQNPKKGTK